MQNKTLFDQFPYIVMILVSIIIINWTFGEKTTFSYLVMILLSIIFFRKNEINELFIKDIKEIFKEV